MALLWSLVGLALGPLLNLLIYRLPRLEKLAAPLSCPRCRVRRPVYLQSALLASLLGARGRCGGCGAAPERLAVAVELASGLAFGLLFLRFGATPGLLLYSLYTCFLIVIFFIDWQHHMILNRVVYPGTAIALGLTPAFGVTGLDRTALGLLSGGLLFALLYGLGYLVFRQEALGLGDVKLAMLLGAMAGFPEVMWWFWLGGLLGGLVAAAKIATMLITRRGSPREYMPYGTALALGAFAGFFIEPWFLS